jgi:hypothetical protein
MGAVAQGASARRKQLALVAPLGLLGLAGLVGALIASLPPPEQTFRLGDGPELTLEGVTYGKTRFHLIEAGGLTERILHLLPGWVLNKGGFSKASIPCDDPGTMVFWIRWPANVQSWPFEFLLRDGHGCELPLEAPFNAVAADGTWLRGHTTRVLPHRGSTLVLRVAEREGSRGSRAFVEIPVWNPAPEPPALEAQTLPAVWESDELEVTLREFTTGWSHGSQRPLAAGERGWARLLFDAAYPGRPGNPWEVQGVEVLDGDGDAIPVLSSSHNPPQKHWLEASPCFEEVWRIRFAFVPGDTTALPPGEVWRAEGLETGAPGDPPIQLSLSLRGAAVQLNVRRLPTFVKEGRLAVEATVTGTFPQPIPRLRCAVNVGGARAFASTTSRSDGTDGTVYKFEFSLPLDAKKVDITLALPRVRVVDFTARPSRASMESP